MEKEMEKEMENSQYNNAVNLQQISPQDIYNGGGFKPIDTKDLLNNETAINQLLNDHNQKAQKVNELLIEVGNLKSDLDFQRTSPFYAIIAAVINAIGSVGIGVGGSYISKDSSIGWALIIIGIVCLIIGNIITISHRWVRIWFNKKQ